jgi:hypothetical protein
MKTQIKLLIILVIVGVFSCEKNDSLEKDKSYLEYLKDKAIIGIYIHGETKYILTSRHCDTCYVAPHMSHIPTIEEWTVIKDSTYENFSLPEFSGLPIYDNHGYQYKILDNVLYKMQDNVEAEKILSRDEYAFTSFAFDNEDNIWFYGDNIGIAFWNKSEFTIYSTVNSQLPTNRVNGLKIDKSGAIWVSLDYKGLLRIKNEEWEIIPKEEIPGLTEYSYLRGPKIIEGNSVWFEVFSPDTSSNILKWENNYWIYEFPDTSAYCNLIQDSKKTIWAITNHYNYSDYKFTTLKYYKDNSWIDFNISDLNTKIMTVNADNSTVYIGTLNGLIEKPR